MVAVNALGDSGLPEAIVALGPALNDSDENIRQQAEHAIESLRKPDLEETKGPGKKKDKKKKK